MESSSHHSSNTNQSPIQVTSSNFGYSTPPRSNFTFEQPSTSPDFSQLFHQSKILNSSQLKRLFSPIHSPIKKRRRHLIELEINRKTECIVPLKQHINMPVILKKLFDDKEEEELPRFINEDNSIVPISSSISSKISSKTKHISPIFDSLISNSFKNEQENSFSISETIIKQKYKTLLKNK